MYTGPPARRVVKELLTSEQPDKLSSKWKVFIFSKFNKDMQLRKGMSVLHQVLYGLEYEPHEYIAMDINNRPLSCTCDIPLLLWW